MRNPWCHREAETGVHVMFLCDFAKTVWTTAGLSQRVNCSSYENPGVVFERVFEQCTKAQSVEVAMLCWSIWNCRNRWVWDRANGLVFGVRSAANHLHSGWVEAQAKTENRKIRGEVGDRVWSLPAVGWLKVNVDAVVSMNGTIGVGAVIRDDRGCFVGARCLRLAGAWKPREAEAIGLKEALSWITGRGYTHCVIETDSYALADACNGNPGRASFGTIVRDCVHLLKHINQVLVNFVYRSANNVAHVLAQATYSMSDVGEWYVTPPNFLMRVVELELDLIV